MHVISNYFHLTTTTTTTGIQEGSHAFIPRISCFLAYDVGPYASTCSTVYRCFYEPRFQLSPRETQAVSLFPLKRLLIPEEDDQAQPLREYPHRPIEFLA
jgi:hypothetical protein